MELGNEARATAANAQLLLAADVRAHGPDTAPAAVQRIWLPPPSQHGAPPVTAAAICAWPQHCLPHPLSAGWGPWPAHPPQAFKNHAGQVVQPKAAAALEDSGRGQNAGGVVGQEARLRADSVWALDRDTVPARSSAQPWRAVRNVGRPEQKPGQALVPLQIDGSGRVPASGSTDARDIAAGSGQKIQTANRGGRVCATSRSQREVRHGSQQRTAQQRRVRNWNHTDP